MRDDLMAGGPAPQSWEEVLDLAARRPGAVALPLSPPHAISSWLSIAGAHGGEPFASDSADARATAILTELARLGPREALDWEPPDALGRMTATDEIAYIPLTYGYSTYGTAAERPCRFVRRPGRRRRVRAAPCSGEPGWRCRRRRRTRPRRRRSRPGRAAPRPSTTSSHAPAASPATGRPGTTPSSTRSRAGSTRARGRRSRRRGCARATAGGPRSSSTPGRLLTDNLLDGDPDDLTGRLHELHRRHST